MLKKYFFFLPKFYVLRMMPHLLRIGLADEEQVQVHVFSLNQIYRGQSFFPMSVPFTALALEEVSWLSGSDR